MLQKTATTKRFEYLSLTKEFKAQTDSENLPFKLNLEKVIKMGTIKKVKEQKVLKLLGSV